MATEYTIANLKDDIEAMRERWTAANKDESLSFDKEKENVLQALTAKGMDLTKNYALKLALNNPDSVKRAIMATAIVGITLDPASKFAYLVPRDNEVKLDISYMGLMEIAVRSGSIRFARARMVHAADTFELGAEDQAPVHKRNPFLTFEQRGDYIGVYVTVKTLQGDWLTDPMNLEEVYNIRARSPSYQGYEADNKKKTPWVTDFPEMAKKSVVKNAYKYWPRSDRLDQAIHYLNTDGGQGIELGGDGGADDRVDIAALHKAWDKKVDDATDGATLKTAWEGFRAAFKPYIDAKNADAITAYGKLRQAAEAKQKSFGIASAADASAGSTSPQSTAAPAAATKPKPTAAPAVAKDNSHLKTVLIPKKATGPAIIAAMKWAAEAVILAEGDEVLGLAGPCIDALPEDQRPELDEIYNECLAALNTKHGRVAS